MTLVAIYYHKPWLPVVQNSQSVEKFLECCEKLPTDWAAHLMNEETGEILYTWRRKGVVHSTRTTYTQQALNSLNRPK